MISFSKDLYYGGATMETIKEVMLDGVIAVQEGVQFVSADVYVMHTLRGTASVSYLIFGKKQPDACLRFSQKRFTDIADRQLTARQMAVFQEAAPALVEHIEHKLDEYDARLSGVRQLISERLMLQRRIEEIDRALSLHLDKTEQL